jgi:hypothetical protein
VAAPPAAEPPVAPPPEQAVAPPTPDAVNDDASVVVGQSWNFDTGILTPVLWTSGTGLTDLNQFIPAGGSHDVLDVIFNDRGRRKIAGGFEQDGFDFPVEGGAVEDEQAELDDQSRLLGDGDELARVLDRSVHVRLGCEMNDLANLVLVPRARDGIRVADVRLHEYETLVI